MATKKKAAAEEPPRDRRCSFRAVDLGKRKIGNGRLAIEHRLPGSTIWSLSLAGLDTAEVETQLRNLETKGCSIEYNEFFQPDKVKKRR